jgi:hypothetical protein
LKTPQTICQMIETVDKYNISTGDVFFFDNNVWMFVFGLLGNSERKKQEAYSKFLKYVLERKCTIFINSLALSEFVNTNLRYEYDIWRMKVENKFANKYKEHFLKSSSFLDTLEITKINASKILKFTTKGNDNFNAIETEQIFSEMIHCDFNDAYFIKYAQLGRYKIVTDDKDFFKGNLSNVDILTFRI